MACGLQRPTQGPPLSMARPGVQAVTFGAHRAAPLWPFCFLPFKATSTVPAYLPPSLVPALCSVFFSPLWFPATSLFNLRKSVQTFPNWFSLAITPVPRNSQEPSRNLPLSPKVHLVPFKDSPYFLLFSKSLIQPVSKLGHPPPWVVMSPDFASCSGGSPGLHAWWDCLRGSWARRTSFPC